MELNVPERVSLLKILPREGNYLTMKMVKNITGKVILSEEEAEKYEFRQEGSQILWNDLGKTERKEINLDENEISVIKQAVIKLENEQKITMDLVCLHERFILNAA